ncbi:nickel-dependent hydrogenase large subunit [Clostridium sp. YIM B02515]|uniref:Nickel-dependent hydrogenase large subunit n=1 Tax=Clostridium rhizosphaerae TaxID=2803861 RepID=A0ABS1T9B9_9CLOT|nr:nickel-dependent hydrogenase large subunit [Clostridium rhizosphaerae]MBL4935938.1 nickel-dependent hydrogenase large subunit [Clostridium rhizosphaerae]
MSRTITINPITRISGFMEIEVKVENSKVIDAKSSGLLFRGFEKMLLGRSPFDAIYFTERICGICSTAHSVVSTLALEDAIGVQPNENDKMLRDIIHGWEFIQNHIRHFYLYTLPDFVLTPEVQPVSSAGLYDLRLPEALNKKISEDYLEAVKFSRLAHQGLAVLGGKAPHNHGVFVGGVTEGLDASKLVHLKYLVSETKAFINNRMLEDVNIIADYYKDYFKMGIGYGNLMSYGVFDTYKEKEISYVNPAVLINGQLGPFEQIKMTENIYNSWYKGETVQDNLFGGFTEDDMDKAQAYSFVKAPRYQGHPMEVGPLARMILSGNYENKISMMDRTIARVLETKKVIEIIEGLLERVSFEPVGQRQYDIPDSSRGSGLKDTTRGSLGHWVSIENNAINHYNIITPSAWNCSPTDSKGVRGVIEQALIGTELQNPEQPVEIGRIVRSYDPCISCATHVVSDRFKPVEMIICP